MWLRIIVISIGYQFQVSSSCTSDSNNHFTHATTIESRFMIITVCSQFHRSDHEYQRAISVITDRWSLIVHLDCNVNNPMTIHIQYIYKCFCDDYGQSHINNRGIFRNKYYYSDEKKNEKKWDEEEKKIQWSINTNKKNIKLFVRQFN